MSHYRCEHETAHISLDDGKVNALGSVSIAAVNDYLDQAVVDRASAVIISGRNGVFSAGFDLKELQSDPSAPDKLRRQLIDLVLRIFTFESPIVMACTGHALAAGAALLLAGDRRIGVDGPFKLGFNEARLGVSISAATVELARYRMHQKWFSPVIGARPVKGIESELVPKLWGQRCRARDAEPKRAEVGCLSRRRQAVVHGGDTEEHGGGGRGTEDCRLVKAVEHHGGRPGSESTEQPGAKAVHVKEWQAEHQPMSGSPIPGGPERCHTGQKRPVGVYSTLGLARGSGRVDDQRVVAGLPSSRADKRPRPLGGTGQLLDSQDGRAGSERIGPFAVAEGERRSGISDHVVDFGSGGRRAERNQNRAGAHHGEQSLDRGKCGAGAPQDAVARGDAPLGQCRGQSSGACDLCQAMLNHHPFGVRKQPNT